MWERSRAAPLFSWMKLTFLLLFRRLGIAAEGREELCVCQKWQRPNREVCEWLGEISPTTSEATPTRAHQFFKPQIATPKPALSRAALSRHQSLRARCSPALRRMLDVKTVPLTSSAPSPTPDPRPTGTLEACDTHSFSSFSR